jgi:hypothetical protein
MIQVPKTAVDPSGLTVSPFVAIQGSGNLATDTTATHAAFVSRRRCGAAGILVLDAGDGAAIVYFLGQLSATVLSQRELIAGYRGAARVHALSQPQGRAPSEVFTEWAATDRDIGMAAGHAPAVDEMLAAAMTALGPERTYTAIDAGCGNG